MIPQLDMHAVTAELRSMFAIEDVRHEGRTILSAEADALVAIGRGVPIARAIRWPTTIAPNAASARLGRLRRLERAGLVVVQGGMVRLTARGAALARVRERRLRASKRKVQELAAVFARGADALSRILDRMATDPAGPAEDDPPPA